MWLSAVFLHTLSKIKKTLLLALDLAGTFVFALSGAFTAVKHRLDLFGILVLSLAAATFGGISRDLLIGAVPPAALMDWRYIAVPVVAGITVFFSYSATMRLHTAVLILDGAGLAVFAVSGALKALRHRQPKGRSQLRLSLNFTAPLLDST